jgi:hypothetical protein
MDEKRTTSFGLLAYYILNVGLHRINSILH